MKQKIYIRASNLGSEHTTQYCYQFSLAVSGAKRKIQQKTQGFTEPYSLTFSRDPYRGSAKPESTYTINLRAMIILITILIDHRGCFSVELYFSGA